MTSALHHRRSRRPAQAMRLALALLAGPFAAAGPAGAATPVGTGSAPGIVPASCVITVAALPFSTYTGKGDASTASLTVICTATTPYNIALSAGTAPNATVAARWMSNGRNRLAYSLCSDAGHTLNWGQTIGVDTVGGTGTGHAQVLTVYGQIAAGQYPKPGDYGDTILATVIY